MITDSTNIGGPLDIWLPELPDMRLSTNGRHRLTPMAVGRLVREEKARWYWLILEELDRAGWLHSHPEIPWRRATIAFRVAFRSRRAPDYDNLWGALKPILDVLCAPRSSTDETYRVGIIADDGPTCLVSAELAISLRARNDFGTAIKVARVE
jgi:hypothetical protein